MTDLISRQAAIDAIRNAGITEMCEAMALDELKKIPPIDCVKIGAWIPEKSYSPRNETGILYVCSECGAGYEYKTNFCPSCGAKM